MLHVLWFVVRVCFGEVALNALSVFDRLRNGTWGDTYFLP